MSEYNFTIDWSKWSQALRYVSTTIIYIIVLATAALLFWNGGYGSGGHDGFDKGYEQGKQDGFQVGLQNCTKRDT